jgi:hypothetical protein
MSLLDSIKEFKRTGLRKPSENKSQREQRPAPAAAAAAGSSGGMNLAILQGIKLRKTGRKL